MMTIHRTSVTPLRLGCPCGDTLSSKDVLVDVEPGLLPVRWQLPGGHAVWFDYQGLHCAIEALLAARDKLDP